MAYQVRATIENWFNRSNLDLLYEKKVVEKSSPIWSELTVSGWLDFETGRYLFVAANGSYCNSKGRQIVVRDGKRYRTAPRWLEVLFEVLSRFFRVISGVLIMLAVLAVLVIIAVYLLTNYGLIK